MSFPGLNMMMMKTQLHRATPFSALHNDTGLKAYYKFDEASGNIINLSQSAVDLGSAADGTVTGATYGVPGIQGAGLDYDGINDLVELGTSLSQWNFLHDGSKNTINLWLKLTSIEPDVQWGILGTGEGNSLKIGTTLLFADVGGSGQDHNIRVVGSNGSLIYINAITTASFFPKDTDYHMLTATYDGALGSNQLKLFMDGGNKEQFSRDNSESASDASNPLELGTIANDILNGDWAGMDECSIWDVILTDAQITDLYNNGKGRRIY